LTQNTNVPKQSSNDKYYLRNCPKCDGDLYKDKDIYGEFLSCLQCGFLKDLTCQEPDSVVRRANMADTQKIGQPRKTSQNNGWFKKKN